MKSILAPDLKKALQGYDFEIGQTVYSVSHETGYIGRHKIYGIAIRTTRDGLRARYLDQDNREVEFPTPDANWFGHTKSLHTDRRAAKKAALPLRIATIKKEISEVQRSNANNNQRMKELQEELIDAENRTGDQN